MKPYDNAGILAFAMEQAKTRPDYMAWVLAQYMKIENLTNSDLVTFLRIGMPQLPRLGLCLRPRREHFVTDVEQISSKFRLDSYALARVVRLVDSISTMTKAKTDSEDSGMLMAARARKNKRKQQGKKDSHDK